MNAAAELSKNGRAALRYAEDLGWAVFPLHNPTTTGGTGKPTGCSCNRADCTTDAHKWGKHPRVRNGVLAATTAPAQIREWWTMWPDSNIGVATGTPSKMVVIDVDGPAGDAAIGPHLEGVETPRAKTGGGWHYVFALPPAPEIRNAVRILPEVDVRATGGYIVVAPSQHGTGRVYQWDKATHPLECVPKPLPASLSALLVQPSRPGLAVSTGTADDDVWGEGARNDRLFRYVASRVAKGLREHEVRPLAHAANDRRCRPPLSAEEVDAIVSNALGVDHRKHGERPDPVEHTALTALPRTTDDGPDDDFADGSSGAEFPEPLGSAAYHGLLGEAVRLIAPESEADPAAIMVSTAAILSTMPGRTRFVRVGRDVHFCNLFAAIVCETGVGKGISLADAKAIARAVCPDFLANHQRGGLSSGEGLMAVLSDSPEGAESPHPSAVLAEDCFGRRVFVPATEMGTLFQVRERQGNTIMSVLRQAYDGEVLETLVRKHPLRATDVHMALLTHVTPAELRSCLKEVEVKNGFVNRFLFVAGHDVRDLPNGGEVSDAALAGIGCEIRALLPGPSNRLEMRRNAGGDEVWEAAYRDLKHPPGDDRLADAARRGRAHVLRLSMLYAILDGVTEIGAVHVQAALEVWRYCRQSLRYALGARPLSDDAQRILTAFQALPEPRMTWEVLRADVLQRHWPKNRIQAAVKDLTAAGLARVIKIERPTGGRPRRELVLSTTDSAHTTARLRGLRGLLGSSLPPEITDHPVTAHTAHTAHLPDSSPDNDTAHTALTARPDAVPTNTGSTTESPGPPAGYVTEIIPIDEAA